MIVINVFVMSPIFQWYLFLHLLMSDLAVANSIFFLALACLFLQCCVNKMVTPHSHVLNLKSVRASALHLCINSFPTNGALEEYSRRPTLHQYSTKELLDLKLDYPCSDVVHRHLQDLSLSVVPVPTRSLPP